MNAGTRVDHNQFCRAERWELVRDVQGRPVRHHVTYELALDNGSILRTRISRPVDKSTYGPRLWKRILRDQLSVSEEAFWAWVSEGRVPARGQSADEPKPSALPAGLVYQLIHVVHVPEGDVKEMTLEQAIARMADHWSGPPT